MPPPTFSDAFWVRLAKADYVEYRKLKAAQAGRRPAQMIALMNELESRLAVRGRVTSAPNTAQQVMDAKKLNAPANKALASRKLDEFLNTKALPLKDGLDLLADYLLLAKRHVDAKWVAGPLT